MRRAAGPPVGWGWGWELGMMSCCGQVRATEPRGTCTALETRRRERDGWQADGLCSGGPRRGPPRRFQLSPHAKNRTKLTEGNLRLLAAGSPPSAPPPRPAALALRLFSMAPDSDDVGRVLIGVRMASLEVQWVMGPEPAGT